LTRLGVGPQRIYAGHGLTGTSRDRLIWKTEVCSVATHNRVIRAPRLAVKSTPMSARNRQGRRAAAGGAASR
jgi:hypothetical protein